MLFFVCSVSANKPLRCKHKLEWYTQLQNVVPGNMLDIESASHIVLVECFGDTDSVRNDNPYIRCNVYACN